MTTPADRAAEIIHQHHDNCTDAAAHLDLAGLITPNLPKPTMTGEDGYAVWNLEHIDISADAECQTVYVDGNDITPKEARAEAAALLAAAAHAQKEETNE